MNRCSTLLNIRQMQTKTAVRYIPHHTCQDGYYQKVRRQVLPRIWRKYNPCTMLVRTYIGTSMENGMQVPQNIIHISPGDTDLISFGYILRSHTAGSYGSSIFIHVHCQHYSQQPRYGNNLSVHQGIQWIKAMWQIHTTEYFFQP